MRRRRTAGDESTWCRKCSPSLWLPQNQRHGEFGRKHDCHTDLPRRRVPASSWRATWRSGSSVPHAKNSENGVPARSAAAAAGGSHADDVGTGRSSDQSGGSQPAARQTTAVVATGGGNTVTSFAYWHFLQGRAFSPSVGPASSGAMSM